MSSRDSGTELRISCSLISVGRLLNTFYETDFIETGSGIRKREMLKVADEWEKATGYVQMGGVGDSPSRAGGGSSSGSNRKFKS